MTDDEDVTEYPLTAKSLFLGDVFCSHSVEKLIRDDDALEYLQALDKEYKVTGHDKPKASWFKGQQVKIDLTGRVRQEWESRKGSKEVFEEL
jgi:hypothetical protein